MKLIIANWKANKNVEEAENWINEFLILLQKDKKLQGRIKNSDLKVVIAPGYHLLHLIRQLLPPEIALASQDVSFYERGSYTGEVPASVLVGLVEYAIIGHSERRKYFHETNATIDQKVALAKDNDIEPILCIRGKEDLIPKDVFIVAYEPVHAIGHAIGEGGNEAPEKVIDFKKGLRLPPEAKFLYGGSANETNAADYIQTNEIDGFLIGTASKDVNAFFNTLVAAI